MKKWFLKEDTGTILSGDENEILSSHQSVVEIGRPPDAFHIWDNATRKWILNPVSYRHRREAEYPAIGDQLDAILKHMNYMQMTMGRTDIAFEDKVARSCNLVTELDTIISKWLSIKSKYPKPQ